MSHSDVTKETVRSNARDFRLLRYRGSSLPGFSVRFVTAVRQRRLVVAHVARHERFNGILSAGVGRRDRDRGRGRYHDGSDRQASEKTTLGRGPVVDRQVVPGGETHQFQKVFCAGVQRFDVRDPQK